MSFTLVIDSREAAVKKELDKLSTEYFTEQLDVGDMIIKCDNVVVVVFERKTYADLDSSIVSKRHQQQRQRLKEFKHAHACTIGYILEGRVPETPRIRGAIENLVFKHGFCVIPSASAKNTADVLTSLMKKYSSGELISGRAADASACTKCAIDKETLDGKGQVEAQAGLWSKKSQIAECVFYHQLLVVPQVGEKLAQALADEYTSAGGFIAFLNNDVGVDQLGEKKVGSRRIGKKTAQRIADAFQTGKVSVG